MIYDREPLVHKWAPLAFTGEASEYCLICGIRRFHPYDIMECAGPPQLSGTRTDYEPWTD